MDEDGGQQAEDNRRRGREHVEANCEVLETLERAEDKNESEETQETVELAEVEVNEEEAEWRSEVQTKLGEERAHLELEQVRQSLKEEMNYVVKTLAMFEFDWGQDSTSSGSKASTATKCID